ncbi:MAG TPA: hypothetical protein VIV11_08960 [Kofleriaceae bacterium]
MAATDFGPTEQESRDHERGSDRYKTEIPGELSAWSHVVKAKQHVRDEPFDNRERAGAEQHGASKDAHGPHDIIAPRNREHQHDAREHRQQDRQRVVPMQDLMKGDRVDQACESDSDQSAR